MAEEPKAPTTSDWPLDSPEVQRHKALLRMLGHVKDALRIDPVILYRAVALAGYNANPRSEVCKANPGDKALWAEEDAEALLAVGSDEKASA